MIPENFQTEYPSCPSGCPAGEESLFIARDRLNGLPGDFPIVRCQTCGLVRTAPRPTAASMGFYYPSSYSPYATSEVFADGSTHTQRGRLFRIARTAARRVVRLNTEVVPALPCGRMLEVGCGSGAFLSRMAQAGWQVQGIEFSEHAASKARTLGFDVQTSTVEAAVAPAQPYDLVVGWMVVEHLHDPLAALRKLARWTAPGGWLAISTPNIGSVDFRLFGDAGYALQVPTHLFHFDPRTLTALLEKAGWKVERVFHQRVLGNYLGGIGLWLEDLGAPARLSAFFRDLPARRGYLNHFLYPLAWLMSLFGQTGRMTVWARKPSEAEPR